MKLTRFMLLRRNIRYTVICVKKVKCEINEIHVIKAKYKILVFANLLLFVYVKLICFITLLCFWDAVIYFEITRCQCIILKLDRELKIFAL